MRIAERLRIASRLRVGCWVGITALALCTCRPAPRGKHPVKGSLTAPQIGQTCAAAPSAPLPWRDEDIDSEVSLDFLSPRSRQTLDTLELRAAMARLVLARERFETEGDAALIDLVRARQTLAARLNLVDLEIATVAAEADCHEELGNSIASSLRARNESRARAFTATAITVGAVFGITAGALELADFGRASGGVAISGGIAEVGLGLGFLWTRGGEVFLPIERNLLHEVWEGPTEAQLFPPGVWKLLQTPPAPGGISPREELVTRWRQSARLGRPDSKRRRERIALLFAPTGGRYDIEDLELRTDFLDQLEAELNLLSAALQELSREVLAFDPD